MSAHPPLLLNHIEVRVDTKDVENGSNGKEGPTECDDSRSETTILRHGSSVLGVVVFE